MKISMITVNKEGKRSKRNITPNERKRFDSKSWAPINNTYTKFTRKQKRLVQEVVGDGSRKEPKHRQIEVLPSLLRLRSCDRGVHDLKIRWRRRYGKETLTRLSRANPNPPTWSLVLSSALILHYEERSYS